MKLYSQKPGASIKMLPDVEFTEVLKGIIKNENIQFVFESGTYLGTGSTETLANLFIKNNKIPSKFVTVEANIDYYKIAKKNLAKYSFIQPVFGSSVDYLEAVKFLVNDDIFNHLEKYDNIYIDHLSNPQHGYLKEIMAGVFQDEIEKASQKKPKNFFSSTKKSTIEFKNNMLAEFCSGLPNETALIVLDSAAGIGFYEFKQVKHLMGNNNYFLILDDIQHLKHFRSKEYIEAHPGEYKLISLNKDAGWLVAKSLTGNAN